MQTVCVIGCGPIGNLHADLYKEIDGTQLVGVCDIDHERADDAADRLGVKAWHTLADMLADAKPTMVSVATGGIEYGSDHYEPVMTALHAGVHVLCEKPICNQIAPAIEMVQTARDANLCLAVNLNHRFTPAARLAKQWLDDGRLGHLLFMNMSMWIKNPNESSPWFHIKALHPHTIDIMRYYCGDIEAVHCFAAKAPGRTIYSTAQFNMRFKNGALGHLTGSYDIQRGHPMERCEVAGIKGRFVIDDMFREATLFPAGSIEKTVYTNPLFGGMAGFRDTFKNRLTAFIDQLNNNTHPDDIDASGADGLAAQKVLAAAIESIKTQSIVYIENLQ